MTVLCKMDTSLEVSLKTWRMVGVDQGQYVMHPYLRLFHASPCLHFSWDSGILGLILDSSIPLGTTRAPFHIQLSDIWSTWSQTQFVMLGNALKIFCLFLF